MNIKNVLIVGDYESYFKKYLKALKHYNLSFKLIDEITNKDLKWADAYVGFEPSQLLQPSDVNWIHTFNAGVNNYLSLEGWGKSNTLLTRTISDFGQKMSEYCLSYILADLQNHKQLQAQQEEKVWNQQAPQALRDQTVTIFGTGQTGQRIAKIFSTLGMTVYGISNSGSTKPYFQKVEKLEESKGLIQPSNYIISTLPFTDKTEKLFNQSLFNSLNQAYFINVGRGQVVDLEALKRALDNDNIRHAVLDVFEPEPLPTTSDLWNRKDVTITPHISALTDIDEAITCFYQTLKGIENNEQLQNQVDFENGY
ncbi:D-2-hydroxyacid dehydrogenase [Staphylococcus caeli]|uniref:Phosphoglycerate dehydrogenase n=1 Tax=Staphylococcus caeli TaxID=2201815 RepID=A0A1D4QU12_9STAP|nr:D-2-hydroxyacid dehydrogenase [Staphylococcus caeli]SCT38433.1 phosphoglycerate dehydrogenase [Staphylococcus caeli]SCT38623.1 phosphoglycerate dehydrogenase [Staphylococcus caeli]